MKIFSQEEQKIICRLVNADGFSRNLVNLIDSRNLDGVRVVVDQNTLSASFLFESCSDNEFQYMQKRQKEISELIILYVGLFRYLERHDLAISYTPAGTSTDQISFGMGAVNLPSYDWSFQDKTIAGLIAEYYHKEIIPSHSLRILVKNNFVTEDERRFKSQMTATWTAVVVSFFVGVFSIAVGVVSILRSSHSSMDQGTQITAMAEAGNKSSSEQLNELRNLKTEVNRISGQLESATNEIIQKINNKNSTNRK